MASNLFGDGDRWDLPAPYAVTSGQGMLIGTALFGVALSTVASGATVAVAFNGIYDLTKEPALAIAQGARLFWDNTNRRLTTVTTGNICVGIAIAAAVSADTTVRIRLGGNTAVAA